MGCRPQGKEKKQGLSAGCIERQQPESAAVLCLPHRNKAGEIDRTTIEHPRDNTHRRQTVKNRRPPDRQEDNEENYNPLTFSQSSSIL